MNICNTSQLTRLSNNDYGDWVAAAAVNLFDIYSEIPIKLNYTFCKVGFCCRNTNGNYYTKTVLSKTTDN